MRRLSALLPVLLAGLALTGCSSSGQAGGTATAPTGFGTPSTAEFSSAGSFVTETQPTTVPSDDDIGPVIDVAGPTLDDFYPNLVGVLGPDETSRCIWYSNSHPLPVTIQQAQIRDQVPEDGFRLIPSAPPPACHDYLTDINAPIDVAGAQYGDSCDGATLPALTDPSGSTPRAACVLAVEFTGADDVDQVAALVLTLTAECTDATVDPCDQLDTPPSADEPVTVGWQQVVPLAACRASGSTQNWCGADGPPAPGETDAPTSGG